MAKSQWERDQMGELRPPREMAESPTATIPLDYWRSVPCGHAPDPVAMRDLLGRPICHCGVLLDAVAGVHIEGAPGPVHHCPRCDCYVAVPEPSDG